MSTPEFTMAAPVTAPAFEKVLLSMGGTFLPALPLLLLFRAGRTQGGGEVAR